jgi:hypothetical protein
VPALGRAAACRPDAADVLRLAVPPDLDAADLPVVAVLDRLDADDLLAGADDVLVLVPEADRADAAVLVPAVGAAAGRATDIALAASVSDLLAVVMALVAAFIACSAVDMVLAEDVALVAAAVIFVAAAVTLVAADETVRAAVAGDVAFLEAVPDALRDEPVLRVVLPDAPRVVLRDPVLRDAVLRDAVAREPVLREPVLRVVRPAVARVCAAGRLAERRDVLLLVDLVPVLLARLLRAGVRVVVRAGTGLPPVLINYDVLFHASQRFTHPMGVSPAEQWPQAA